MLITKKIDKVTHISPAYLKEVCPPPLSVKIELTRRCNFKCKFCANSKLKGVKGDMDRPLYERIVKELADLGVNELGVFFFGESFLIPWLPEAIAYAKNCGIEYVFLTTNGSIAYPNKVKECMEAGLDSLKFSLNYADEDQFQEITGVSKKHFYCIKDNIKNAFKLRNVEEYTCKLYASYIKFNSLQDRKMATVVKELEPYLDEVYALPLYSQASSISRNGWETSAGNRGRYDNMVNPLPCWTLFQAAHINFDGSLNACCFVVEEGSIVGDLTKQSFMEAWNSPLFRNLRKANLDQDVRGTFCEKCICK